MLRAAVVEDEREERLQLVSYLKRYGNEQNLEISVEEFSDGSQLVEEYSFNFDVLFLDIEMKNLNGLDTAREIRRRDPDVLLLFVTNLAQYAIEGYEVEALDFIVKPFSYPSFCLRMDKIQKRLKLQAVNLMQFRSGKGTVFLNTRDILYAETMNKKTVLHTAGETLTCSETMNELQEKLCDFGFFRCHNAYLVNMNAIERLDGSHVVIHGTEIPVSKYRKKEFQIAVAKYQGLLL
ncbi:MAG: LytTR family DNA-binding domain-containing protein [Lachnospiraceae bacterium]|nr:LytTR family DNA-binding domain-containing protein [Lachnospiraceae bacterium]